MRIGMDVSIQECRDEGYMVMDYPVYKFKADPVNTDCRFTVSYPLYIREELGHSSLFGGSMFYVDIWLNWEDLWEMYLEHEESINSFIGGGYKETDSPDPVDVLNLASDIHAYCGLV